MSAMSDYLEGELIKHIFRTGSFTKPTVLAVGLFTSATTDAGGGTELTGNGYQRARLDPADANYSSSGGSTSNSVIIGSGTPATNNFGTPTANWGAVTHFAIFDATTGGNRLFHGALSGGGKTINSGDTVTFPIGQLQLTFD